MRRRRYRSNSTLAIVILIVFAVSIITTLIRAITILFKGSTFKTSNGYVKARHVYERPQLQHRGIAEQILGRRLESWEVVHHINGQRHDNRLENLCLLHESDHDDFHDWLNDEREANRGRYPTIEFQKKMLEEQFEGQLLEKHFVIY